MSAWVIELPFERPPLTGNGIQRMHRMQKGAVTKQLRSTARRLVRQAGVPPLAACTVQLVWIVNTMHRRDEDNVVPTLKPLCDGIVDAGIVPDDTPELMEKGMPIIAPVEKRLRRQPASGLYLILWERVPGRTRAEHALQQLSTAMQNIGKAVTL